MHVRPFRLIAASALATARSTLEAAVHAWADDWGLAPSLLLIEVERADEVAFGKAASGWLGCGGDDGRAGWLAPHADLAAELQRTLFAPDGSYAPAALHPASLAPGAAAAALTGLVGALLGAAGLRAPAAGACPEPLPAQHTARGAGALLVQLKLGKHGLRCLLNERSSAALAAAPARTDGPRLPKLASVNYRAVLDKVAVTLTVDLGSANVKLGSLASVRVGDVIRLDTPADRPAALREPGGAVLFDAYLGRAGGSVAVEIAART